MEFSYPVSSADGRSGSELCLVLVGSIGCGKTLTADTLLGQSSALRPSASPHECQLRQGLFESRHLSVVETPRWYWRGGQVEAEIQMETQRALSLNRPGPHVFLILIPVGEFTEMERWIPDQLEQMFGRSVLNHALVLLTCGDYLMGRNLADYLSKEAGLQEVVRRCHGRCHVINNRRAQDRQQVVTLLEEVEQMIWKNGGFQLHRDEDMKESVKEQRTEQKLLKSWNEQRLIGTVETGSDVITETCMIKGLQSQQHSSEETHSRHTPLERNSSYKLTREGTILSNMLEETEVQNNKNFINTLHHSFKKVTESSETFSPVSSSFSSSSDPLSDSSLPELRMVLLGRRGSGKSAAGNFILGCDVFDLQSDGVTATSQQCVKASAVVENQQLCVVNTPDWFNSEKSPEEVKGQMSSCVSLLRPGPHVFLLCVPVNRPAHTELPALRALEGVFGPDAVRRHTVILFTHSDLLAEGVEGVEGVEAYIASQRPEMLELVQKCGDRYHVLQCHRGGQQRSCVRELLEKVQQTVRESGGSFYYCLLDQEPGSCIQQRQEKISTAWRERQQDREDQQNLSRPLHSLREEEEELPAEKNVRLDSVALLSSSTQSPSLLQSVWEKVGSGAKQMPKVVAVGALVGAVLGVFLAGAVGGAVGVALGSVAGEAGRRRYRKHKTE